MNFFCSFYYISKFFLTRLSKSYNKKITINNEKIVRKKFIYYKKHFVTIKSEMEQI